MGKLIDLTGEKFGKLLVLKRGENIGGHAAWICQCDCGNIKTISSDSLRCGKTKSCGCLKKEKSNYIDLTGQKFNKLEVLRREGQTLEGEALWFCQCECGNTCVVRGRYLRNGHTKSCGCMSESSGEQKIKELLKENNISFEQQKKFEDCKDKRILPFDFYVNNKYIIEFDGEQHFKSKNSGWNTEEKLIITQKHDKIKNEYCKNNNIPIIRIPYTHLNDLCLNDLQLETSSFII